MKHYRWCNVKSIFYQKSYLTWMFGSAKRLTRNIVLKAGRRMDQKRKVTIYDVASASGVSASTVGSILNGTWEQRRISKELAGRITGIAAELGYRQNRQASALRTSRSGLIGMILPLHDNRYFSSLSQAFEEEARKRSLCPVVVSTLRDPDEEKRTVATLISHNVDKLFIAGATDPDPLSIMCREAGIPHINVDLPGTLAASVVTDNYFGASELTRHLLGSSPRTFDPADIYFIGGNKADFNTIERIRGFQDTLKAEAGKVADLYQINQCGYGPDEAERAMQTLLDQLGTLPRAIFVNSTIAFEGVFRVLKTLPDIAFEHFSVGCYDWDPFLSHLHFPVAMVRQNARAMIETAFEIVDAAGSQSAEITFIKPELVVSV
jgi:LacI family transcriptional regulator, fructose operon transcriptional repressor